MNKQQFINFAKKHIRSKIIIKMYRIYKDKVGLLRYYRLHHRIQKHAKKYHNLSLQNKIVFANFNGRGYGCNPKYIAKEIVKRKLPYDLVWLVSKEDENMPKTIRQVSFDGEESFKELATAKVIVNNVKGDLNFKKRPGQFYIQTWHGGYSPKFLEKDARSTLPSDYILESKYNSQDSDMFISNSIAQTNEYKKAFWCNCKILEVGLPRNDMFFRRSDDYIIQIKNKLGINLLKKIILFAPTFRTGNDSVENYGIDFSRLLGATKEKFGGDWIVLVRLHPNIINIQNKIDNSCCMDVSKYSDMQELLIISDILITDYSSSMFDMTEMNKPVFIFANDIQEYEKSRGLKPEFYSLPFPIAETNEDLFINISNFDLKQYFESIKFINEKYTTFDKGNASEKVVDIIEAWMKE